MNADSSGIANPRGNIYVAASTWKLNLGISTAINVDVDIADITTETVTNANTSGAALTFSTAGTADVTKR